MSDLSPFFEGKADIAAAGRVLSCPPDVAHPRSRPRSEKGSEGNPTGRVSVRVLSIIENPLSVERDPFLPPMFHGETSSDGTLNFFLIGKK